MRVAEQSDRKLRLELYTGNNHPGINHDSNVVEIPEKIMSILRKRPQ
jgi:hypothetical protein